MDSSTKELAPEDLECITGGDSDEAVSYRRRLCKKYNIPSNSRDATKRLVKVATQEELDYFKYLIKHQRRDPLEPAP